VMPPVTASEAGRGQRENLAAAPTAARAVRLRTAHLERPADQSALERAAREGDSPVIRSTFFYVASVMLAQFSSRTLWDLCLNQFSHEPCQMNSWQA